MTSTTPTVDLYYSAQDRLIAKARAEYPDATRGQIVDGGIFVGITPGGSVWIARDKPGQSAIEAFRTMDNRLARLEEKDRLAREANRIG